MTIPPRDSTAPAVPGAADSLPPEPFPWIGKPNGGRVGIRRPAPALAYWSAFVLAGVFIAQAAWSRPGAPVAPGVMALIIFGGVGGFGVYTSVRRLVWARHYRRVVGRSPW